MTKISNQRAYIPDEEINGLDYLPGTDFDQNLKTVNFRVQDLGNHFNQTNGVRNFDFNFYAHSGSNPKPEDGYFYSNGNEKNPNNIEYLIFSKVTASRKIVGTFFENIVSYNPFDVVISQKVDVNSTFYFRIDSVESFAHYYKLNVSEIYFPEYNEMQYTLSFNNFYLKSEGLGSQNLQQVTDRGNTTTNGIESAYLTTPEIRIVEGENVSVIKAEDLTDDRELFVPDEDGTIATREWVGDNLPSVPTKTSDLTNDGEDGLNPFITANDIPEFATPLEVEEGTAEDKLISPNLLEKWWDYTKTLAQTFSEKITFNIGALFTPIATPTHERGRIYFDDVNDCISFMDSISGTSVQVGQEMIMRARNNTVSTIPNGSVVYISGAIGQNSTVALAQANTLPTSEIIGIATHDIANNTVGKVCVFGLVNDLNTSSFTDGQMLYLSDSVDGGLTSVIPASPNFVVALGVVEHAHPTKGKILVRPQRALANNNALGTAQNVSPTQNAVKTAVDLKQDKLNETNFGQFIDGLDSKTDIKDDDDFIISDSEDSLKSKKTRFLDLKTKLESYFDTFYLSLSVFNDFVTHVFNSLNNKLDKSTTASSVYGTDVGGGQTMIPLSKFEKAINRVSSLNSPSNTTYPTTQAVVNENKKATITVELINQLTTDFYAPNALRINSTALISGSGTLTLKVNDVAYTLGALISQGAKITAETTSASVYNLISVYE